MEYLKKVLDKLPGRQPPVDLWRVQEAEKILEHPLIREFWQQYRARLHSRWCNSRDIDEREELHRLYKTSEEFEQHFQNFLLLNDLKGLNK